VLIWSEVLELPSPGLKPLWSWNFHLIYTCSDTAPSQYVGYEQPPGL